MKKMAVPIIKKAIPHQTEFPGRTVSKSVTTPEVISDHPIVVLYFNIISNPSTKTD